MSSDTWTLPRLLEMFRPLSWFLYRGVGHREEVHNPSKQSGSLNIIIFAFYIYLPRSADLLIPINNWIYFNDLIRTTN
jgi:hypothetical protein